MPVLNTLIYDAKPAARHAIYAVLICTVATLIGSLLAQLIDAVSTLGYLPVGTILLSIYILLGVTWSSADNEETFDPAATFVTFISGAVSILWIVQFFFVDAGLGPFGDELWTTRILLGNAIFGCSLFMLIGAALGTTYYVARKTAGPVSWRRTLIYTVGVGLPVFFLARAEYFLTGLVA